jgi:uncharacterized protein (TIGR03437 family)
MGFVGGKGIRPAIIVCVCLWFSQFAFSDPPSLGVSGNLSFTYQIGGPAPGAGSLVVTNVSHGDMSWDASTDVSWASISPSSGSLPDTFDRGISSPASTVTVNVGGLAPGSYSGSITVSASSSYGVPNSPQSVGISLEVLPRNAPPTPILSVSPKSLSFSAIQSFKDAGSATISIQDPGSPLSWTAAISPPVSWLSITSASMSVTVKAGGQQLTPGSYQTTIQIDAPAAAPSSISVPVTLTVQAPTSPSFVVDTTPLTFKSVAAAASPPAQTVSIGNSGQAALNWQVSASTSNGGGWLKFSPSSGTNAGVVSIRPDTTGLAAGTYIGKATLAAAGATSSPSIPVTLTLTKPASIQTGTAKLSFSSPQGVNPSTQVVSFQNGGDEPLSWKSAATTSSGGLWLKVSPASGGGNGQIVVSVDTTGMAVGTYAGQVALTCDGGCSGITIPATLAVLPPLSTIVAPGVVNAARLTSTVVSAGGLATVFGTRLGPDKGVVGQLDSNGLLLTSLGGTTVLADGVPAPLFYVGATQINFQIPYEEAGKTKMHLVIQPSAAQASELDVALVPSSFALFTTDGIHPLVLNQDYAVNSSASPITAGNVVILYGTGQGPLSLPVATGAPGPSSAPFPAPMLPITITVNGEATNVLFAGTAPGMIGVAQVNLQIPDDIPNGPATLTFQQGSSPGGQTAVIYVTPKTDGSSAALRE